MKEIEYKRISIFLILNILDLVLTIIGLSIGGLAEGNFIYKKLSPQWMCFIKLGLSFLIVIILITVKSPKINAKRVFDILNVIFTIIVLWNLICIILVKFNLI